MLQQVQTIDRRLVIGSLEITGKCVGIVKEPHTEPFAAAVRLEDEGASGKALARRRDKQFLAGDENGIGRADAGGLEGGVLTRLADLEVESAAAVDDAALVPLEPGQHRRGQLGGVAVVAGMRGGAHPIVVDTLRRRLRQIEDAAVEKPVAPRKPLPIERRGQRRQPGRVLVNDVDLRHRILRDAAG